MKLIVDIPEEEYFVIKHYGDIPLNKTYFTAMSIINGIPLDKIRSEIEEHAKINQNLNTDRARALCWCLDVIDNIVKETEDGITE